MLHLELHETWSDENFVLFKRVPREPLHELVHRKVGCTTWPDESIIAQGWHPTSWLVFHSFPYFILFYLLRNGDRDADYHERSAVCVETMACLLAGPPTFCGGAFR